MKRNKLIYSLLIILCLSTSLFAKMKAAKYITKDYQVIIEVKPGFYSNTIRKLARNLLTRKVYLNVQNAIRKKMLKQFGINVFNHKEMIKVGLNLTQPSFIVYTDIFITQKGYYLLNIKNKNKFYHFIQRHLKKQYPNSLVTIKQENVQGNKLISFIKGNETLYTLHQIGNYFLISKYRNLILKVLKDIKTKKTLSTEERYFLTKKSFKNAFAYIHIKPKVLSQGINGLLLMSGDSSLLNYDFKFFNAFSYHTFSLTLKRKEFGLNHTTLLNIDHPYAIKLRKIAQPFLTNLRIVEYLPSNPYLFLHLNGNYLNSIKLFKNVFPGFKKKYLQFIKEVKQLLGINFDNGFLNTLGRESGIAIYSFDPRVFMLKLKLISNMNLIAYVETKNTSKAKSIINKLLKRLTKVYRRSSYRITRINRAKFYRVKSKINGYIGIVNNYIIFGTRKTTISRLINRLRYKRKTNFLKSLRAPNLAKMIKNGSNLNFYINLQKVFKKSIITLLAKDFGLTLNNLKNFYFSSHLLKDRIISKVRLRFM